MYTRTSSGGSGSGLGSLGGLDLCLRLLLLLLHDHCARVHPEDDERARELGRVLLGVACGLELGRPL